MVADVSAVEFRDYPPDLIQFVSHEAARDADDVIALLTAAGLAPPPGETHGFLAGVLLDLSAVVRLGRWEVAGYAVHVEAGLPTARMAMSHVIRTLVEGAADKEALRTAGTLGRAVFDLAVMRFAWTAQQELGADIVLAVGDEDALVEALARFLWTLRDPTPGME